MTPESIGFVPFEGLLHLQFLLIYESADGGNDWQATTQAARHRNLGWGLVGVSSHAGLSLLQYISFWDWQECIA